MKKFSWHKFYKFPTGHTLRSECEYPYKPPMKGGHRHNHIYNKCHKYVFRGKNARKIDRNDKKEFVRIFYIGLKLNRNFGEFLHKIFHKNNRSTAQQGKGKKHV